jgi:hypothetical protein
VVCLAPRVPGESVGLRRLSDVVARPLNFTVRSHDPHYAPRGISSLSPPRCYEARVHLVTTSRGSRPASVKLVWLHVFAEVAFGFCA